MNVKDKLHLLSEDDLRRKVVIPLLSALGCQQLQDNCGPSEYGKDIVYIVRDHFLKEKIWGAAVVKKSDINKSSIDTIHRQIVDAITPFPHPDNPGSTVQVHEILLITSRGMTSEAQKYINENSGKCFPNIHFINGDRLEFLINEVIIEYNKRHQHHYVFSINTFGKICGKGPGQTSESISISRKTEGQTLE